MTSAHSATPPRDIRAPIQLAMAMLLVACSAISSLTGQFGPPATVWAQPAFQKESPESTSSSPHVVKPASVIRGDDEPSLEFTSIPDYGSPAPLTGIVRNIDPTVHKVIVYLQVEGGFWGPKPYWDQPFTEIEGNGTWTCNVVTGGIDEQATLLVAFAVRNDFAPPRMAGHARLPDALEQSAVAKAEASRVPAQRKLHWSHEDWLVKSSPLRRVEPGANWFADLPENVWVDERDRLHLRITQRDGRWYAAEIIGTRSYGWGTYRFYVDGQSQIDTLDPNVTAGLFLWSSDPGSHHREIDIEFGRWGNPGNSTNAQWVVQPYQSHGNLHRFTTQTAGESLHSFEWRPGQVLFHSESPQSGFAAEWLYTGPNVPSPGDEHVRINLWPVLPPAKEIEIVVSRFSFEPLP